jgi:hypothetical protein
MPKSFGRVGGTDWGNVPLRGVNPKTGQVFIWVREGDRFVKFQESGWRPAAFWEWIRKGDRP